jgi:adenosylcobinamide kinase / adenosylcobinamide-phosphate guanylyltransferase
MTVAKLILVGGGARSGKSRLACEIGLRAGERRAFVATATAFDDEMKERIARHRAERGATFETLEAAVGLGELASEMGHYDVVLLDCLTLYLSNRMLEVLDIEHLTMAELRQMEVAWEQEVQSALAALRTRCDTLVVVTNEVGQGVVPASRLGRLFRDVAGRINQAVAGSATEVWLCAFGLPLRLKPSLSIQNPLD